MKQKLRQYSKILLLLGAILLFFMTPLRNLLDREFLSAYLQKLGIWAVPIFISTYVLVTILGLPVTIHTLTGGIVFGLVWGTIWSILAATLGAIGAFWIARSLFQEWATMTFSKHQLLAKMNQAFERSPCNLVLMLRLAPIAPFNLVNLLLALTPISKPIQLPLLSGLFLERSPILGWAFLAKLCSAMVIGFNLSAPLVFWFSYLCYRYY